MFRGRRVSKSTLSFIGAIVVAVSPRFGTWDDAQLSIIPGSSVTEPSVGEQATQ